MIASGLLIFDPCCASRLDVELEHFSSAFSRRACFAMLYRCAHGCVCMPACASRHALCVPYWIAFVIAHLSSVMLINIQGL